MKKYWLIVVVFCCSSIYAQETPPKPLFDDPLFHGAADPVVVYNKQKKVWWMFYTNRRASAPDSNNVAWVHGTRIGIAESKDGRSWKYKDTANINYRPDSGYTFWAPDITEHKGLYHMYLTYVPGIFKDWQHPRDIIHLTSRDLLNWQFESVVPVGTHKVIDASICKVSDTLWRMWYNDEKKGKRIFYADSKDLYQWEDKGETGVGRGEGPKVFAWKGKYFMIVDVWKGMEVYCSDDLLSWKKQTERILEMPGKGKDDQAIGGHCDVVVNDGRAFIFYFTHPGRTGGKKPDATFEAKRSVIQLGELHYENGVVTCDRDEAVKIKLK